MEDNKKYNLVEILDKISLICSCVLNTPMMGYDAEKVAEDILKTIEQGLHTTP